MYTKKIAFIGGDMRQIKVINRIFDSGAEIKVFGFNETSKDKFITDSILCSDNNELRSDYTAIVLPLPYSSDGENINAVFGDEKLPLNTVFKSLKPGCLVLAGKCDEKLKSLAVKYGIELVDYFEREELMVANAVPTAEGAIQLAMEETPHTLNNSECLITGSGRISKILAKMLHGLGARVTVAARNQGAIAAARAFGYSTIEIGKLTEYVEKFDIVFNTVPAMVFNRTLLEKVRKNSLLIDLASKPGGVDFDAAKDIGLKVVWALSLPGKVAPDTAGNIIADTILNILDEKGV